MDLAKVAYKAIPIGNGIIFLFESIVPTMQEVAPTINIIDGTIYLMVGDNLIPIMVEILQELRSGPIIYLAKSNRDDYQLEGIIAAMQLDTLMLAKIEGALECAPHFNTK